MDDKRCPQCGLIMPLSCFSKDKSRPAGVKVWCRECCRAYSAAHPPKPRPAPSQKTCKGCGEAKAISEFYRNKLCADGYRSICKVCIAVRGRLPEWVESRRRSESRRPKRTVRRDPLKTAARNAVKSAIARGELAHWNTAICAHCGGAAVHYHHQNGYEREHWLDVIPLCRLCHSNEHSKYLRPTRPRPGLGM